jgi:ribosomal protein L11 methyltransferase
VSTTIDCVELQLTLPERTLPQIEGVLWLLSPNGIQVEDALCLAGGDLDHGHSRVRLYVAPQHAEAAVQALRRQGELLGLAIDVSAREVEQQDWNRVWKQHYKPIDLGGRLRIEPAWDQGPEQPGVVRVAIDPGMAFGTGSHETTQLCAQALLQWSDDQKQNQVDLAPLRILDLGTGSAILAVLAVKLGVGHALGTEVDAAALGTARTNLTLNGVQDRVTLLHSGDPQVIAPETFPLVVANILASVLVPLCPLVVKAVQPSGTLVLSGILAREAHEVAQVYVAQGLQLHSIAEQGAWACLVLRAPA